MIDVSSKFKLAMPLFLYISICKSKKKCTCIGTGELNSTICRACIYIPGLGARFCRLYTSTTTTTTTVLPKNTCLGPLWGLHLYARSEFRLRTHNRDFFFCKREKINAKEDRFTYSTKDTHHHFFFFLPLQV